LRLRARTSRRAASIAAASRPSHLPARRCSAKTPSRQCSLGPERFRKRRAARGRDEEQASRATVLHRADAATPRSRPARLPPSQGLGQPATRSPSITLTATSRRTRAPRPALTTSLVWTSCSSVGGRARRPTPVFSYSSDATASVTVASRDAPRLGCGSTVGRRPGRWPLSQSPGRWTARVAPMIGLSRLVHLRTQVSGCACSRSPSQSSRRDLGLARSRCVATRGSRLAFVLGRA